MVRFKSQIIIAIFMLVGVISCSGKDGVINPAVPPLQPGNENADSGQNGNFSHYIIVNSLIYFDPTDPEDIKYEIVPLRVSDVHLNILKLLEEIPCSDCFSIVGLDIPEPGFLNVDIEITHPFTDPDLTIFDVRGIIMFGGSHVYPVSGLTVSDSEMGDGELLNADGYTALYNSSTLESAPGPYTGYYEGNFATATMPDADVNGYKRHNSDNPFNTRNAFYAGDSVTSSYQMKIPEGEFVLGYAVDANWAVPLESPVDDPMEDFGIDANCPEPWKIKVNETQTGGGLTSGGGQTTISVLVYDWNGKISHGSPRIECPEIFTTPVFASWVADGSGYSSFQADITNSNLAIAGEYRMLIWVEANENDPVNKPWLNLTAYQMFTVEVTGGQPGDYDPIAIASADQNPQLAGYPISFDGGDSYDPDGGDIVKYEWQWDPGAEFLEGTEVQEHIFNNPGTYVVQLRVTDDDGQTDTLDDPLIITIHENPGDAIARTWGGPGNEIINGMAMDGSGNIYTVGIFNQTTDFDPGPDLYEKTPSGQDDIFLSKFNMDGVWLWTNVIGGSGEDVGYDVEIDGSGGVVICGYFTNKVDFDPGPDTENIYSEGYMDAFIVRFDPSGNFSWVITWGSGSTDWASAFDVDGQGRIDVAGSFAGSVDFDPGDGTDIHTSTNVDIFLIQFDSSGTYIWGTHWGDFNPITASAVAANSADRIIVLGQFKGTVDFHPGDPAENFTSKGDYDVYLNEISAGGEYLDTFTWGGSGEDSANDIFVFNNGYVFITGEFEGTVDFDPGEGTSFRTADGTKPDAWLTALDSNGDFEWVRSWGGLGADKGYGVYAAPAGFVYVVGAFEETADFDPTGSTDYRESAGETDSFIVRYSGDGDYECVKSWGGASIDCPVDVIHHGSGKVWISGFFRGDVDFDPGIGEEWHSAVGNIDSFLSKIDGGCD